MIKTISQLIAQLESENCVYALRYEKNWRYVTNEIRDAFHYNGDKSGVYAKRMLNLMEK